jgi:hypothetical protein
MGSGIRRAVTLAGFAIAALALASCGDDETAGNEQTLTYFEGGRGQPPEFFGPGTGPGGPPVPGGGVAISHQLEDADGNAVGDVNYICFITGSEEGGDHVCTGLVDLPDGQLNIAYGGDIKGPPGAPGSITGGTGDYAGATGTYEVVVEEGPPPEEGPGPPPEEGPPPGEGPKQIFTFTLP